MNVFVTTPYANRDLYHIAICEIIFSQLRIIFDTAKFNRSKVLLFLKAFEL